MQHEQTSEIGRIGRTEKVEAQDIKPLVNSPELRALVVREFKRIEEKEEEIGQRREDIKNVVDRLARRGLSKKGINIALARRKLVAKGGLEEMDETLALICGIKSLGIQGDLFLETEDS